MAYQFLAFTNKMGRKVAATLVVQALQHALSASKKLGEWYERLCEYKKRGLVITALRLRVFAEMYQMLKKGEYHYGRCCKLYDASNPAIIYVVKGEGKRLEMADKLLREIAAAPERPPHAAAQV